jgi:hypothetical protein
MTKTSSERLIGSGNMLGSNSFEVRLDESITHRKWFKLPMKGGGRITKATAITTRTIEIK